jgi:hypothetical protein
MVARQARVPAESSALAGVGLEDEFDRAELQAAKMDSSLLEG